MKPYGVKYIGPMCEWGCCYRHTPKTNPRRAARHGDRRLAKRRARREGKREAASRE
jgi:hypothetical protein